MYQLELLEPKSFGMNCHKLKPPVMYWRELPPPPLSSLLPYKNKYSVATSFPGLFP